MHCAGLGRRILEQGSGGLVMAVVQMACRLAVHVGTAERLETRRLHRGALESCKG